ncbi:MAG: 2-C-methyl-D-erythritol 2,4-cyclodiphosphate synthase [Pseudomonadota bacterium]|nr:2-C-methyl-D-erythritol 2,4-cyclodiphosphate synthase [Pseudomonadota bacterium]
MTPRTTTDTPARRLAAVIVAAGGGTRMGDGREKQFRRLGERSVLAHSVAAFLAHPTTARIVLVVAAAREADAVAALGTLGEDQRVMIVVGGARRQDSVASGLAVAGGAGISLVAIHDAARPLLPQRVISSLIAALDDGADAALPVLDVVDTMKLIDGGRVSDTIERASLGRAQTPQMFRLADLVARHDSLPSDSEVTDDIRLYEDGVSRIDTVAGDECLMKLTRPADFAILSALSHPEEDPPMSAALPPVDIRTGNGYDVHRFADGDGPVRLGGIDIPHDRGLAAHSDGDVGLHAVCDAIFGALADGDIGSHFPPSDDRWKDADSARFLTFAAARCAEHGAAILHLDLTLVCERPKIGPHRDAMRARIAELAGIDIARVAVKATTSEQLGFTGRGEGIAAQATATLTMTGHPE